MADIDCDLFAIDVYSEDSASESTTQIRKVPRDFQSSSDFERIRAAYIVKIENGEVHKAVHLLLQSPSKQASQTVLHAIEELYFYGRHGEAQVVAQEALKGQLDVEFRKVVDRYLERCLVRGRKVAQ